MSEYVRYGKQTGKLFAKRLALIDFELTERCNNNCLHCCINLPADDAEARLRELTTDQVKDLISQAVKLGVLQVCFTGGEPLLRTDFNDIYLYARRLGLRVILYTNGCLLTPQLVDMFARVPPLQEIEITVYGMHKESYEAVTRTPGSFAQFRHGVDLLLQRAIPFIVRGALLPQNRHEMDEFEAWAQTIPWMSRRPFYAMFFNYRDRRIDLEKNRFIESLRLKPQEGVSLMLKDEEARRGISAFAEKFLGLPGDHLFMCNVSHGCNVSIDAYGRVQPCMGLRASQFTVDTTRIEEQITLQNAIDSFACLSDQRATNPDYLRRCAHCFLNGLCEQCPAKSWTEHGVFDKPVEYLCSIAHAMAQTMGWLDEGENSWEVSNWKDRIKL